MRPPTDEEKKHILDYLTGWKLDEQETLETLNATKIGVADDFISDGPGYVGKIIVVIYSGGPEMHDILIYNQEGKLERCQSDRERF